MTSDAEPTNTVDESGNKTGLWREADDHGGTVIGEYRDGERHGTWRHLFTNGQRRAEGTYERGRLDGDWVWYRRDGTLMQRGSFHDGEKHGRWQRWSTQGALLDEGDFDRGKKVGVWVQYLPDGTIKKTTAHRVASA
ncbi:toxin-antitoxin system YwqK family antitoxin [Pseudonocardia nigra]|uniref:toxin-antitoxin system YwqK family antitoxin n=1 Tax=Pseudonocardia nigra TaxID=1921578 RepID=UPI001C60525B|nr:hypothetical protein [Pseudonocardia nigra]